jgi:hypothetical protein
VPEIMTRPFPCPAARPSADAGRRLGDYLLRVVREQDARIPFERRSPRTLDEMRARMANDACPLCGFWRCRCGEQASLQPNTATVPVTASDGGQCSACGGFFAGWAGGVCDACRATGR